MRYIEKKLFCKPPNRQIILHEFLSTPHKITGMFKAKLLFVVHYFL